VTTWTRYLTRFAHGESLERMTFFSDAVFAIAMTLLIIELRAPEAPDGELADALLALVPGYLTFVLSFVVVGYVWLSHHRKFAAFVRYDRGLPRLNLLMLLFVASLPLPTAILGLHGDEVLAVVLYAATISAIGLTMTGMWLYAWHRGLVAPRIDLGVFRFVLVQSFPIPGVFLLSIPIALIFGATAAELTWIAAIPASVIITRVYRARTEENTNP
jgi:uncharacterized membrane protein